MKKALVLFLVAALVFSAVPAGAASFSDLEETPYLTAITHLSNMGIIQGYEDGSYRPDEVMSRGEFAVVMAKLFGSEESQMVLPNPYFYDVPEDHFAKDSIIYCIHLGLMEGYGDGYFRPDQPITYTEAVKIMVCALGYYALAEYKGGYPTGFLTQANELSILKGIKTNGTESILRGEIAQLAYNALNIQLLEETSFGDGQGTSMETRGNTILTKYLKMDITQGIVNSNGYTKIEFIPDVGVDRFVIGDVTLLKNGRYQTEMLGMYGEAIYWKESGELVSLVSLDNRNRELILESDSILTAEDRAVTYEISEREQKASLSDTGRIIYNGTFSFDYDIEKIEDLTDGYLRMVDNDSDGSYDVVFVYEYQTYVVLDNAPASKVIRDKKDGSKILDLEDYEDVVFRDEEGKLLDYDSIGRMNILNIIQSEDYLECIVSNETKSGEITQITSGDKGDAYHIGDQAFLLSDSFAGNAERTAISVGDNVTLYLNAMGKIAYVEKGVDSGYRQAVLMGMHFEGGLEQVLQFKIFDRSNTVLILDAAQNIYVDGIKYKSGEDTGKIHEVLSVPECGVSQFILYKTDGDGKLREIYTASDDFTKDAKLYRTVPSGTIRYAPSASNFDGIANVDGNTWMLKLPEGDLQNMDADNFQVFSSSEFLNEQYQIEFYNTSKTKQIVDIVNVVGTTVPKRIAFDDALSVVGSVVQAVDENGDIVTKIKYYTAGNQQEAFVSENLPDAELPQKGQIVRISLDAEGRIDSTERYFDYLNDTWLFSTTYNNQSCSNYYGATARVVAAYVSYIQDGYIRLNFAKSVASEEEIATQESHRLSNGYTVYVVSNVGGEIRVRTGDSGDIELLDRVVIRTRAGAGRELYVLKQPS